MTCLAAYGVSWLIGCFIVRAILGARWTRSPWTLRLGLGWASGAAFSGMTTFWAMVFAPHDRNGIVTLTAIAGLTLLFVRPGRTATETESRDLAERPGRWQCAAQTIAGTFFALLLLLWVGRGLSIGVGSPAGGWDAFSIWNQRARFFLFCPEEWTRACDRVIEWSHPEYPNLLPSLIVYGWLPEGRCLAIAPVLVAVLTHVAKLLVIVGLTRTAYPRSLWPWVFGVFYMTIQQEWTQEVAWQYADRPLALFLLAAVGCAALGIREGSPAWYALAGWFWGAAGFCKDEGKAALAVLAVGAVLASFQAARQGAGRRALVNVAYLGAGLLPGLLSLALQWGKSPIATRLITAMTLAPWSDTSRSALILSFLVKRWNHPEWGGMWWGCGLALAALVPWLRRRELWLLWAVPTIQLLIYLAIFQLTPHPLAWHLDSAMPRLLYHLGPTVFVAASWLILEVAHAREPRRQHELERGDGSLL